MYGNKNMNENNIILDMKDIMINLKQTIDSLADKESEKLKNLIKDQEKMIEAVKSYEANKKAGKQ